MSGQLPEVISEETSWQISGWISDEIHVCIDEAWQDFSNYLADIP